MLQIPPSFHWKSIWDLGRVELDFAAMSVDTTEPRTGKELVRATKPFTQESQVRSWFAVLSTALVIVFALAVTLAPVPWYLQLVSSVIAGLTTVRFFILFHDHMHGSLLRSSKPAQWIFKSYGMLVLVPPRVWKQTHNYHHANNMKIVGSHVGSYPVVTTEMWKNMSPGLRFRYKAARHPLTIMLAWLTVFSYGMCIHPFLRDPKKNYSAIVALVLHIVLAIGVGVAFGPWTLFVAYLLPLAVACMSGAYLFYIQHNFEEVLIQPRETWDFTKAALESSSFMKCGPVMNWFTGNIGYHHIHHLNPMIPFYRLPEAMAAIPELQNPHTITLWPKDIVRAFRIKLWDNDKQRMVGYS